MFNGFGFNFGQNGPYFNSNNYYEQPNGQNNRSNNHATPEIKSRICHYEVLGVEKTASQKEIKKAYHKQSLEWHPDKNGHRLADAEERFKLISEAYRVLSDEEKKKAYDLYGLQESRSELEKYFERGIFPYKMYSHFLDMHSPNAFYPGHFFPHEMLSSFEAPFSNFAGYPDFSGHRSRQAHFNPFSLFEQGGPHSFGSMHRFHSPFSMFQEMATFSSASPFSSFASGSSMRGGLAAGSSVSTTTSYVNGRATTYTRTVDCNGNVTTEVHYH